MEPYFLADFIEKSDEAQTPEELFSVFYEAISALGYNRAIYTLITDHYSAGLSAGHGLQGNYPQDWLARYLEKNYISEDPVVQNAHLTNRPFFWDDVTKVYELNDAEQKIMDGAREAGLHNGIGVPLCGVCTELAGFGIARDYPEEITDRSVLSKIYMAATYFHQKYLDLQAKPSVKIITGKPRLTRREREILQWVANGKTDDEIGVILNISRRTVRWNIEKIYGKFDTSNKTVALTKALRHGLIQLDYIT